MLWSVIVTAALLVGCGEGAETKRADYRAVMRANIEMAVIDGRLPPVALLMYDRGGDVDINFIEGPIGGDNDVVRTRRFGSRGPKLQWDLDEDGAIDRDERTITERELYDATLRFRERR